MLLKLELDWADEDTADTSTTCLVSKVLEYQAISFDCYLVHVYRLDIGLFRLNDTDYRIKLATLVNRNLYLEFVDSKMELEGIDVKSCGAVSDFPILKF